MAKTSVERVERALLERDAEARRKAVESLAGLTGENALRLMIRAMGDESWRVRKSAVDVALTHIDSRQAVQALIHALHVDDNADLRSSSSETLIRMGEIAVPALIEHIRTPNEKVRKFVIDALGGIGDSLAVPALLTAMDDASKIVRSAAAENLGLIGSEEAFERLVASLQDDDLQFQQCALRALARIGRPVPLEAIRRLLENRHLKRVIFACLGNVSDLVAVDLLLDGIGEGSPENRAAAAASLVKIHRSAETEDFRQAVETRIADAGGGVQVETLLRDLETSDLDSKVALAELLGLLGDPSATLPLILAAGEGQIAECARDALVRIGRPARSVLLENLSRLEDGQRAIACAVLAELGEPE